MSPVAADRRNTRTHALHGSWGWIRPARWSPSTLKHDRYRTIVHQCNRHMRAKPAEFHAWDTHDPQCFDETVEQFTSQRGVQGGGEIGTPPTARIAVQRELGYREYIAADVHDGELKTASVVGKYPQIRNLVGDWRQLAFVIGMGESHQQQQATINTRDHLATYRHRRRSNSLNQNSHRETVACFWSI